MRPQGYVMVLQTKVVKRTHVVTFGEWWDAGIIADAFAKVPRTAKMVEFDSGEWEGKSMFEFRFVEEEETK